MKKLNRTLFSNLIILVALFSLASCHRCVECVEQTSAGGKVIEWPEICGKKTEIQEKRKFMESVVNPGNKVKCTERKTSLL